MVDFCSQALLKHGLGFSREEQQGSIGPEQIIIGELFLL